MNCDFELNGEIHRTGSRMVACKRCGVRGLESPPGTDGKLHRPCPKYPFLHELGNCLWLCLEAHFITKTARCRGRCDARQKALNDLGQRTLAPGERMG